MDKITALDLDYASLQHHLSVLLDVGLVQTINRISGNIYLLTNEAHQNGPLLNRQ